MSDEDYSESSETTAEADQSDATTSYEPMPEETNSFFDLASETTSAVETGFREPQGPATTPIALPQLPTTQKSKKKVKGLVTFTIDGTPTTVSTGVPVTLTLDGEPTIIPASRFEDYPHLCYVNEAKPIVIQDEQFWNEIGCLEGFACMFPFNIM